MKNWLLTCLVAFALSTAMAQEKEYLYEIGAGTGISWGYGDVNASKAVYNPSLSYSLLYRYNLNLRWALAAELQSAGIKGDTRDFDAAFPGGDYNFSRRYWQLQVRPEVHFWNYGLGSDYREKKRYTPFLTAGLSAGNATPVAEFNVFNDPIAYDIMLQSGIPITIIGLDKCDEMSQWTNEQFELLKSINYIGKFVYASFGKLREFYAMNGSADSVMNCDALAMSCLIFDGFINKTVTCHGKCVTHDCEAYGQVIFYRQGFTYDVAKNDFDYNVELVTDVDEADYFYLFLRSITT